MGKCSLTQRLGLFERGWIHAKGAVHSEAGDEAGKEDQGEAFYGGGKTGHVIDLDSGGRECFADLVNRNTKTVSNSLLGKTLIAV